VAAQRADSITNLSQNGYESRRIIACLSAHKLSELQPPPRKLLRWHPGPSKTSGSKPPGREPLGPPPGTRGWQNGSTSPEQKRKSTSIHVRMTKLPCPDNPRHGPRNGQATVSINSGTRPAVARCASNERPLRHPSTSGNVESLEGSGAGRAKSFRAQGIMIKGKGGSVMVMMRFKYSLVEHIFQNLDKRIWSPDCPDYHPTNINRDAVRCGQTNTRRDRIVQEFAAQRIRCDTNRRQ
jgi:hypothetical protein